MNRPATVRRTWLLLLALALPLSLRAQDVVVYSNDFDDNYDQGTTPALWSGPITTSQTQYGDAKYLGYFGNQDEAVLTLTNLPPHTQVTVAFRLHIFASWDHSDIVYGPDRWGYGPVGEDPFLEDYFPMDAPDGVNVYGYSFDPWDDRHYDLDHTFAHTGSTLALRFYSTGAGQQGFPDEFWGLDNVTVKVTPTEPSACDADLNFQDTPGDASSVSFAASPAGAEFIAIYNNGASDASLDGCTLVLFSGRTETSYAAYGLSGTVPAGGSVQVGDVGQVLSGFSLRDGPDAFALYDAYASSFPNGTGVTTTDLVSAVVYRRQGDVYGAAKGGDAGTGASTAALQHAFGGRAAVVLTAGDALPTAFALEGNYPNPFNPQTTIRYALTGATDVHLAVYDALGREVRSLVAAHQEAGAYEVTWDGRDTAGQPAPSGVYLYRLTAGAETASRAMLLAK